MAGDVAADVGGRDSGLAAEHRDDGVVDVAGGDAAGPDSEQRVDQLAGAAVGELRLVGAGSLPGVDGLAENRVDRLGEGGAGLVGGDVEQADRVAGQDLLRVAGDRCPVVLPADAAHPQPGDLVASLSGEQPGQCDRADQVERVEVPGAGLVQVGGLQIQPCHNSFARTSSAITLGRVRGGR
ncbi:hypothetical protein [Streptomyces griseosporeus]|uniref:hypothetical protein n=1 Tax=Streptomyces griseosporeus TaxID=1910 RepID=UPI0036F64627